MTLAQALIEVTSCASVNISVLELLHNFDSNSNSCYAGSVNHPELSLTDRANGGLMFPAQKLIVERRIFGFDKTGFSPVLRGKI